MSLFPRESDNIPSEVRSEAFDSSDIIIVPISSMKITAAGISKSDEKGNRFLNVQSDHLIHQIDDIGLMRLRDILSREGDNVLDALYLEFTSADDLDSCGIRPDRKVSFLGGMVKADVDISTTRSDIMIGIGAHIDTKFEEGNIDYKSDFSGRVISEIDNRKANRQVASAPSFS